MVWCTNCARNVLGHRPFDGALSCNICGRVLEDFNFSFDPTFVKNAAGQSQLSGNVVRTRQSGIGASRERTLRKSREDIMNMKDGLGIGDERDDVVDIANRLYGIAVERNFTRGRKSEQVQASCLYFACREKNIPFLLIDFSNYLSINVYELGAVYLQLCEMLYIADNKNFEKLVDPSIFIPKFTSSLLHGGNKAVVRTARDIIASMKRDWMQTGRKPSGICGAALYIAALSHGLKCSKLDIVRTVHICEATLTKRLDEFEDTEAGSLTVEELMERERELYKKSLNRQPKESIATEVLCRHQDCKPFAYGLCRSCYDDFMTVSGGLEGGANPPAFQRAEKERLANTKDAKHSNLDQEHNCEPSLVHQKIGLNECEDRAAKSHPNGDKCNGFDSNAEASDGSDNFSDIDDFEVDGYIHNEEERQYKKIIWEEMNREYLEEQAAKEAAAEAAREALKASFANCSDDVEAARKLAEATAAAVAKSRKERRKKRAAEAKNTAPPKTAAEATRQMLSKKRISSKINYDALEGLFDTSCVSEDTKKRKTESPHSDNEVAKVYDEKQEPTDVFEEEDHVDYDGAYIEPDFETMDDFNYDEDFDIDVY